MGTIGRMATVAQVNEIDTSFLKLPVLKFVRIIVLAKNNPNTQVIAYEIKKGQDLFVGSSLIPTKTFVSKVWDDIKLVNYSERPQIIKLPTVDELLIAK